MDNDKYVYGLMGKAASGAVDSISTSGKPDGRSDRAAIIFLLSIAGLLLVSGAEVPKVLMRTRIGRYTLGLAGIIISAISYALYSWALYYYWEEQYDGTDYEFMIFQSAIIFYALLAAIVLVLGLRKYFSGNEFKNFYRGDSIFFGYLLRDNENLQIKTIWGVVEPVTAILVGALLTWINPILGVPVLATAVSFFINELYFLNIANRIDRENRERMRKTAMESFYTDEEPTDGFSSVQ